MQLVPPPGSLRTMAVSSLVNTFGNGLFYTSAALYYTRQVHLSPGQVGIGLTVAGFAALLVGVPAGHLADLRGAREILIVLNIAAAAAMTGLALVHGFAEFLAVVIAYLCLDKAAAAVRQGLIASVFSPEERVRGRAYLRAVTNLGIGAGSLVAGVAIGIDSRPAYLALLLGDAATYLLAAAMLTRLPRVPRQTRAESGGMLLALKDRPFVVVTALSGVMGMHYVVLEVGAPLWVDRYTSAPRWTVAVLFLINTTCCVLFQVRASKSSVDVRTSALANRRGGLLLGVSCVIFALSDGLSSSLAVGVLVLAALVNVAGELFQSSGSWGIGFGLSPENAQGQYQGLYSTGFAAAGMLGPLVVTSTAIALGRVGWLLLAALFVGTGLALVPVTAWAERSRVSV